MVEPFRFAVHFAGAFVHDEVRHGFLCNTVIATALPAFSERSLFATAGPMQTVSPGGGTATTPVPGADGTEAGSTFIAGVAGGAAASGTRAGATATARRSS